MLNQVINIDEISALRDLVDEVFLDEKIAHYILDLVSATRKPEKWGLTDCTDLIRYGASPRAGIFLVLAARGHALLDGRSYVVPDDVKSVGMDILRHRGILSYEASAEQITSEDILRKIFDTVEVP